MQTDHIVSAVKASEKEIVDLTARLIGRQSPTGKEKEVAQWLEPWLRQLGFDVDRFDIDPDQLGRDYPEAFFPYLYPYEERPNVVGRLTGLGGGRSLMINFHMDVVDADPACWQTDPWTATVKDGRLFGRGAADMKGGAAAALVAVKTIVESGIRLNGDLLVAGVVEEEGPGNGTLALQARGIRADGCIIPEPTDLAIAPALTGGIYGFITISGKSAHSTTPWEGVNALEKAASVIRGIARWRNQRRELPLDPLYGHAPETPAASPVVNITRTDGANIGRIPSSVQLMTRATVMPGEDPKSVADAMEKVIRQTAAADDPWFADHPPDFSWIIMGGRSHPARLDADHPLYREAEAAFSSVTGKSPAVAGFVSPADMQQLMNIAPTTPALMFGPGSLSQAHADDESVPIPELVTASAVMADFILRWCGAE